MFVASTGSVDCFFEMMEVHLVCVAGWEEISPVVEFGRNSLRPRVLLLVEVVKVAEVALPRH